MFAKIYPILFFSIILLLPACLALDAPIVSSSTHPEGEWGSMAPYFSWEAIDNAYHYCYVLDEDSETIAPDEPCTENTYVQMPTKIKSGDYFFHIKAVFAGTQSDTTTYPIKLDVESPEWVSWPPLSAEATSVGTIVITWAEAKDDASGIKEFEIYRKLMAGFTPRDTPIHTTVSSTTTSFTDTNDLEQSTSYHYIVRALDNSGRFGLVSNEAVAATAAQCDLEIVFSVGLSENEESLLLGITSNDKIYRASLKATLPDGTLHTFFEAKESFLEWEETFDLSSIGQGYIDFELAAEEFLGDDCGQEKRFVYDVEGPKATFVSPKYNDRVSETVPLKVNVEDIGDFESGINSVEFFVKQDSVWNSLGAGEQDESGVYSLNWDSFAVENGSTKLKVEVVDMAGNLAEAMQTLNVLNAFESALDTNSAINSTIEAGLHAMEVKWELESKAIFSEEEARLIAEADASLAEAKALSLLPGLENETNAKMLLAQAMLSYKQSESIVSTSVYRTADFIFNKEQVSILLNAAGISGQAAQQATEFIEKYRPERKLEILKVVDTNSEYFRALINVSFELDVNILADSNANDKVMQVIEVVPKEFAEYAALLDSNISFTVLFDDPKLSFALTRTQYRTRGFSYALKDNLSQAQADALIDESVVNKFVAPPIMLPVATNVSGFGFSTDFLVFAGASVAVVAVVLLALVFLKKRKHKPGKEKRVPFKAEKKPKHEEKPRLGKKPKKPFGGFGLPKLGKKHESPLSVFGKG